MMCHWRAAVAAAVLVAAVPRGAQAQIDYRNLDDDRPTRIEDAYPVERYAFELIAPYRVERERDGTTLHAFIWEAAYGIVRNGHFGLKLPVAAVAAGGRTTWGLSGLRAFALYNFNTESPLLPALALRADGVLPVGALGGAEARGAVRAIATRSFGRSRLHLNGEIGFGPDAAAAAVEGATRWWYGAALDRTLFRHSTLLIAEVYALRPSAAAPVEVHGSLGVRRQVTPTLVLDAGISRGFRKQLGPEIAFTLGFSHALGIGALMPRGRRVSLPEGGTDAHRH